MTKLLNIDANAKTVKGQKQGYMTAIMYLAPFKAAGINVCPMAEMAGCVAGCLNTAGRGGIAKATTAPYGVEIPDNAIQAARVRRTRRYADNRELFMLDLEQEIRKFIAKAERKGLVPVVRLNGTSDIRWENMRYGSNKRTIFETFDDIQFYDYTKIYKRFERQLPTNYHLSLSASAANQKYQSECWNTHARKNASLVIVTRSQETKDQWLAKYPTIAIDGDASDLRFLDKPGSFVMLKAKGAARKDTSGFVFEGVS